MQITALFQDLVNQIIKDMRIFDARDINLGDLLTAQVKSINGDNVLVRVQGKEILAKSMVPLEVGETITFQFQGYQQGKAIFKIFNDNLPGQEQNILNKVLNSLQLPQNETNRQILSQMIQLQLPLIKEDVLKLSNMINKMSLPDEKIGDAVFLFKQGIPITDKNINYIKEFTNDNFELFKGKDVIKNIITNNKSLPEGLINEVNSFLGKLEEIQITFQDDFSAVANKLARSLNWQAEQSPIKTSLPDFPQVNFRIVADNQIALLSEEVIKDNNFQQSTPQSKQSIPEISFSKIADEHTEMSSQPVAVENNQNNIKPSVELIKEQIELLAEKSIKNPDKLDLFIRKIKEVLAENRQEIAEVINTLDKKLDSTNPHEQKIKEVLREISNKISFLDNLIPSAPNDNNQQVLFYAQSILDNGQNQSPINLTIKRPADQQGRKINFNDCTLTVSLQTLNLGFIKATVKKINRNLSCQLFVYNQKVKEILEPSLPQLAESLEQLDFQATFLPIKVAPDKLIPNSLNSEKPINLFNIDVRI